MYEYVLWFDVSVNDPVLVAKLNGQEKLLHEVPDSFLRQPDVGIQKLI